MVGILTHRGQVSTVSQPTPAFRVVADKQLHAESHAGQKARSNSERFTFLRIYANLLTYLHIVAANQHAFSLTPSTIANPPLDGSAKAKITKKGEQAGSRLLHTPTPADGITLH